MNPADKTGSLAAIARSCGFRRGRRDDTGASLGECASILPVFALMLFGMIQFGLAFAGWDQLRSAVQTSARVAVNNGVTPSPDCGQPDEGSNLVCQVALSIGAPLDTAPAPLGTLTFPPGSPDYGCTPSPMQCTGGYAWLDGYYIFENGQWLQIVKSSSSSDQITDTQAFGDAAATWTCGSPACTSIVTNVTGQGQNALGSDNIAINVDKTPNQLQVCAQRQIVSFTAFPGLQNLHISTTSAFYIPLTGTATTVLGCPNQPTGPPCTYQSANGVSCG
jgi:hypothetical protein